jgi:hypothetical protein
MSDTPQTDAEAIDIGMEHFMVDADFARKLERERDEAAKEALYYKTRYELLKDSDTPETDKLITDWLQGTTKDLPNFVEVARRLERERDTALDKIFELEGVIRALRKTLRETSAFTKDPE